MQGVQPGNREVPSLSFLCVIEPASSHPPKVMSASSMLSMLPSSPKIAKPSRGARTKNALTNGDHAKYAIKAYLNFLRDNLKQEALMLPHRKQTGC
jgi:hypothetical protein